MDWVFGIDVSHHQGHIDWGRVSRSGKCRWAYGKATEGTSFVDSRHAINATGARAAGVPFGSYHFARPNAGEADARAEARHFAGHLAGTLPPMLDLEATTLPPDATASWALAFLDEVQRRTGRRPLIYVGSGFPMAGHAHLAAYDWWVARYPTSAVDPDPTRLARPRPRAPWGDRWSIWQYTSSGRVDGIAGNVDRNVATAGWFARAAGTNPMEDLMAKLDDDDRAWLDERFGAIADSVAVRDGDAPWDPARYRERVVHTVIARDNERFNQDRAALATVLTAIGQSSSKVDLSEDDLTKLGEEIGAQVQGLPDEVVAAIRRALD